MHIHCCYPRLQEKMSIGEEKKTFPGYKRPTPQMPDSSNSSYRSDSTNSFDTMPDGTDTFPDTPRRSESGVLAWIIENKNLLKKIVVIGGILIGHIIVIGLIIYAIYNSTTKDDTLAPTTPPVGTFTVTCQPHVKLTKRGKMIVSEMRTVNDQKECPFENPKWGVRCSDNKYYMTGFEFTTWMQRFKIMKFELRVDEGPMKSYTISTIGDVSADGSVEISFVGNVPSFEDNSRLLVTILTNIDIAQAENCKRSDFNITGGFYPTLTLISDKLKALPIERNSIISLTSRAEDNRNFQFLVVSSIDGEPQQFLIQPLMQSICDVGRKFLPDADNKFRLELSKGDGSLTALNKDSLAFNKDDQLVDLEQSSVNKTACSPSV